MAKRDDLQQINIIESELRTLENRLEHFKSIDKLHISSGCTLDLQNYDEPSAIGYAYRKVQAAIVEMLEKQVVVEKGKLEKLGVHS